MTSLSVITPSFDQLEFLKCCSASVADQQGLFRVEHLVHDGRGGVDLAAWAASQQFSNVVIERDSGMYDAINRGFRRATGDILSWLNCDEQYLPGALEYVRGWFEANPSRDILFGDVIIIDSVGTPVAYRRSVVPQVSHIRHCFLPTLSAATFVRRSVIDRGYFLDTRFRTISDAIWIDRLLSEGFRAGAVKTPLAVFAITGNNLGQSSIAAQEMESWKLENNANSKQMRVVLSGLHKLRKLFNGAYRSRNVTIEIHAPESQGRIIRKSSVGFAWK